MIFEGDVAAVVAALQEKKSLIDAGRPDEGPRILFVGGGGVMYGCEAGGTVTALHELGYGNVFDWVLGLSTSAPAAAYFLGGNPRQGTTIYSEECCTPDFISLRRLTQPVNTAYLDQVFRGLTQKRINAEAAMANRTKLLIGITNANSGKQVITEPETVEKLFRLVHISISIPGASGLPIKFGDHWYTDGAVSYPIPIKSLVGRLKPTHVLVIPNRRPTTSSRPARAEAILYGSVFRRRVSPVVRAMAYKRGGRLIASLRWLREESGVPFAIAWSSGTIRRFERNPKKIREAAHHAEIQWKELLA